tara:strand:- start:11 stop:532 length:522 start_codon:yes stop_codon:yes gene_type:complete
MIKKSFRTIFNKTVRDIYWKKNEQRILENFLCHLLALTIDFKKYGLKMLPKGYKRNWDKNGAGYNGTDAGNGIKSGLTSKAASLVDSKYYTHDHVMGATQVGKYVEQFVLNNNWKNSKVREAWVYKNLYLWGTIRVTKKEHKKVNIRRGEHTITEKNRFKHYENVSKIILIKK